jgi:hypothetical protein
MTTPDNTTSLATVIEAVDWLRHAALSYITELKEKAALGVACPACLAQPGQPCRCLIDAAA